MTKGRHHLNLVQLYLWVWEDQIFDPGERKKVPKKNFSNDIARINSAVNFYNNDNAMYVAWLYRERVISCWAEYQWPWAGDTISIMVAVIYGFYVLNVLYKKQTCNTLQTKSFL